MSMTDAEHSNDNDYYNLIPCIGSPRLQRSDLIISGCHFFIGSGVGVSANSSSRMKVWTTVRDGVTVIQQTALHKLVRQTAFEERLLDELLQEQDAQNT
eukprot:4935608-Amphidinium_carterae.2